MKCEVAVQDFRDAVERAASAADRTSSMPILGMLLLRVGSENVEVVGTDLGVTITGRCARTAAGGEFAVAVEGQLLKRFAARLPAGKLVVDLQGDGDLLLTCGSTRATMPVLAGSKFPKHRRWPAEQGGTEVDAEVLRVALQAVLPAAQSRTITSIGPQATELVCVVAHGDSGEVAATDGHRVHVRPLPIAGLRERPLLVPGRGAQCLANLLMGRESAHLCWTTKTLFARVLGAEISIVLGSGLWLQYRRVFPDSWTTRVVARREALIAAVERAQIWCGKDPAQVGVDLHCGEAIRISRPRADNGGYSEQVDVTCAEGPGSAVHVNAGYLRTALRVLERDEITISLGGALDPLVLSDSATNEGGRVCISVMQV